MEDCEKFNNIDIFMLDKKDVAKIARLARIEVTEAETEELAVKISGVLQWVEQLNEVNTDNMPMLASVAAVKLPWREDKVTDGNQQQAVLKNAPKAEYNCFEVPKVME
jgi:aspartyl-tRNA(Asn)/glutamyl-tRNA(Gln) amidotransferase subunit C